MTRGHHNVQLYPASLPAVRSPRVARRQKSRQGSESSSLSREQTNPLPDSNIPTPPALKDHAFAAFLRNIDPSLPLAQQALYMLGIQTPALINSFAYLPNRDGWLRSLMEEGRLDLKTFQVIRTAMTKHCLVTETPPPRFISRFRPTLSDSNIVQSMLDSIYPRLGHLRLPMEKLGIVTANDLEAIVKSTHRDREFLNTVLKTGIMSPIEAMLVCNAFTVLAATGILAQLKPVD
ncbi:hypothetical protein BDY19DRAFT_266875 [Irpex rosettiformis]|uniref:Uncharacterized protein n=1 Tax=Irpex rosettiformis TaxID=378272 RepID=A0ACB8UH38_9APHY|nr:hypothetical protein BDY19DRAFT_266875 [Irpex rosettiformis]